MRLHGKMIMLILPMVVLPMIVVGLLVEKEFRESLTEKTFGSARSTLHNLALFASKERENAISDIELLAQNNIVRRYAYTENEKKRYGVMLPAVLDVIKNYQKIHNDYYEIRFIDTNGYEEIRSTTYFLENQREEEGNNELFREMTNHDEEAFTRVAINPDNGQYVLYVSKALFVRNPNTDPLTSTPKLRGYLVFTVSLDYLQQQVNAAALQHQGSLLYLSSSGSIIFHQNNEMVGTAIPSSLHNQILSGFSSDHVNNSEVLFNENYYIAHKVFDDFILVNAIDKNVLGSAIQKTRLNVAAITVATIFITTTLIVWLLDHLILNRLSRLREFATEIGRGNFIADRHDNDNDEIGDLNRAFVDMGRSLSKSSNEIKHIANHDSLTGLPNRRMFYETLHGVIARSNREGKKAAIIFLDLDDFKTVNDTLGHDMGDEMLKEVTRRLSKCLREEDLFAAADDAGLQEGVVARLGGDEFIIILSDIESLNGPIIVAERILASLKIPIMLGTNKHIASTSIGITIYPDHGDSVEALIKNADIAMYSAKASGKNTYKVFTHIMNKEISDRHVMEQELLSAIDNNELYLVYQPRVSTGSGELVGTDALLRWENNNLGVVSSDALIKLAEEIGIIADITQWALNQACRQNMQWYSTDGRRLNVSVNLSSVLLMNENILTMVKTALDSSGMPADRLVLEITETSLMSNSPQVMMTLVNLSNMGVSLALDDFGTGYSSLSHLLNYPINIIKIDKSFIINLLKDTGNSRAIVKATIAMAKSLNMQLVAEGVENKEQYKEVRELGVDYVQGYLFGKPVLPGKLFSAENITITPENVVYFTDVARHLKTVSDNKRNH